MAQALPGQSTVVSAGRITLALIVGALAGAGLVTGLVLVTAIFTGGGGLALVYATLAFGIALPVWFVGLLVIGLPAWVVLRAFGLRSRRAAAGAGAVLAGGAAALWAGLLSALSRSSTHELLTMVPFLIAMALIGAVVGWVAARVAYPKGAH